MGQGPRQTVAARTPWPVIDTRILFDNVATVGRIDLRAARWRGEDRVAGRDTDDQALRRLMVAYQDGDRDAFERLHAELAPELSRRLLGLSRDSLRTDDLVQETFLQVHRARHTYDPAYPLRPWLFAIARHVFLMDCRYRRRRSDLFRPEPIDETTTHQAASHEQALLTHDDVHRALRALSPGLRQSVLLHHLHGLTFQEISRRLQVRAPALRARASRGVARLRGFLSDRPRRP